LPVTTANTAKPLPSGDEPRKAVPRAPLSIAPGVSWPLSCRFSSEASQPVRTAFGRLVRGVCAPTKTPPALSLGAFASGAPSGSSTLSLPTPLSPKGAFATHGRPKPLLMDR